MSKNLPLSPFSSPSTLLLVSDFCRPHHATQNDDNYNSIMVNIIVSATINCKNQRMKEPEPHVSYSHLNTFAKLHIQVGDKVVLQRSSPIDGNENNDDNQDSSNSKGRTIIVELHELLNQELNKNDQNNKDDEKNSANNNKGKILTDHDGDFVVVISPIAAANLGIFGIVDIHCGKLQPIPSSSLSLFSSCLDIPFANVVKLRPLACPIQTQTINVKSNKVSNLQTWLPLKPNQLICQGHVTAVYKNDDDNIMKKRQTKNENIGRVYFYEIVHIERHYDNNRNNLDIHSTINTSVIAGSIPNVFVTATTTKYEFDYDATLCPIPRLPCLPFTYDYFGGTNNYKPISYSNKSQIYQILNQYQFQSTQTSSIHTATSSCRQRVIHIVGTNREHHIDSCLQQIANELGRVYFGIRGLAAFAASTGTHKVTNGSIVDKLAGLKLALDNIIRHRHTPCLLHLADFDTELASNSANDPTTRQDEEERIWSTILNVLEKSEQNHVQFENKRIIQDQQNLLLTPPILVVISTIKPFEQSPGPIIQNIVFPTLYLDTPNESHIRHLWEDDDNNHNVPWASEMIKLLQGRGACDILTLRQQLNQQVAIQQNQQQQHIEWNEDKVYYNLLQDLCIKWDATKRRQNTQMTHISNVYWEDIGGIAHVRQEIMDAIELPLKYPHLFPNSSNGRSGILLYGPPGTGKTLVAKAVATECGLPFLSVKGPELLGTYVGESEGNVQAIFASARQAASNNHPHAVSILFFDELDSLAPRRGGVGDGGGVMERVVATLFAELDNHGNNSTNNKKNNGRVFVMGATNRPDLLDPSLLRPGRLDRLVYLGIPTTMDVQAQVLAAQIRKLRLENHHEDPLEVAKQVIQAMTVENGNELLLLSGADLSTIASTALMTAVQRLCQLAEQETEFINQHQQEQQSNEDYNELISVDEVLEGWDEQSLIPIVTVGDLIEASRNVLPSVTAADLEKYERLQQKFNKKNDIT